ncbi:MAG: hypothetical protein IPG45_23875 [Deltaproteobacteria bacterium]|nr:hypothetical protein [Deltaproteobacteria bacterium]
MSPHPQRLALGSILLAYAAGCASKGTAEPAGGPGLQVVLPSESLGSISSELIATVLVPLLPQADRPTRFLECRDLLNPRLPLLIDFEHLGDAPFGVVLEQRQPWSGAGTPNLTGPWPTVPIDPERNPWGAALIYLEARGPAQNRRGEITAATQLVGCTCFRTQDASHPDPVLDAAVKAQCPLPEASPRPVPLVSGMERGWSVQHQRATTLVAPVGHPMTPGALVKVVPPSAEHRIAGRVVHFAVDLGSGPGPWSAAVTDEEGIAAFRPTLEGCGPGARILARLGPSDDPPLVFDLRCVPGIGSLGCQDYLPLATNGVLFEVVERGAGLTPWLATISSDQPDLIRMLDPQRGFVAVAQSPSNQPAALYSFNLEVNVAEGSSGRPMVVSIWSDLNPTVIVHELDPERWTLTEVARLDETCATWTCGSGLSCDPLNPCDPTEACVLGKCQRIGDQETSCPLPADAPPSVAGCACAWSFDYNVGPYVTTGDLDGDGLNDLLVGGNRSSSLVSYRAHSDGGPLYRNQTCNCGAYGAAPQALLLGRFRVLDGPLELAIATSVGLGLIAQHPEQGLICSTPNYVGPEEIQQAVHARLGCTPALDPSCPPYQDLIVRSRVAGDGRATAVLPGGPGLLGEVWFPEEAPDVKVFYFGRALVGDLNGDNHDDLLTLQSDVDGALVLRASLGAGNGALSMIEFSGGRCGGYCDLRTARLADLDGDGRDDLLLFCPYAEDGPEITVFRSLP